ncbi:MAG: hypothetical protein EA402_13980 [Planctomycetota bacterium]|nr:MAG: hypothetical protein EA402_13980 [Planctomycetota bacterium]
MYSGWLRQGGAKLVPGIADLQIGQQKRPERGVFCAKSMPCEAGIPFPDKLCAALMATAILALSDRGMAEYNTD